jgi:hypothetical protein
MPLLRVYADFNAIEYLDDERTRAEMSLTGYGTLASLARQKLRLHEGMALLLYETNDIECEAEMHFDSSRLDPAGRRGEWIARLDPSNVRASAYGGEGSSAHPCIVCERDLASQSGYGSSYTEKCAGCGASIMVPLAPPKNAT